MPVNTITLTRLLLTFDVITLVGRNCPSASFSYSTIRAIFFLDALGGYLVRKPNRASESGEVQALRFNTAPWIK